MKLFTLETDVSTEGMKPGELFAIGFPKFHNIYKYHAFTKSYSWVRLINI